MSLVCLVLLEWLAFRLFPVGFQNVGLSQQQEVLTSFPELLLKGNAKSIRNHQRLLSPWRLSIQLENHTLKSESSVCVLQLKCEHALYYSYYWTCIIHVPTSLNMESSIWTMVWEKGRWKYWATEVLETVIWLTSCWSWRSCFLVAAAVRLQGQASATPGHRQAPNTASCKGWTYGYLASTVTTKLQFQTQCADRSDGSKVCPHL